MQQMDFEAVAAAWAKWWPVRERGSRAVSERMVELARIGPGARVLDLGTGLGEPALSAAKAVAPGGRVTGVDVSPAMVRLARERARNEGVSNVEFVEGDAATYSASEPFDAILSRWGLMFLGDVRAALAHLRGQLRPAGRFVATVWGAPPEVPMISLPMLVAMQRFGKVPEPVAGGPFALYDVAALRAHFEEAGYGDIEIESIPVTYRLTSPQEYYEHVFDVAPPLRAMRDSLDETQRAQLREGVEKTVAERFSIEGEIRIPNRAIAVTANNPAS